ncbi:hypothetical protein BMS3Abin05_02498 [bacterium BMS3Abin05]|nr:hypothetical protein BMS3Abin05_02498 [bacterium BMS3Abin05]GBE26402.1 hypothetical protein BMS3Bbin03_00315 [bacterium BMS3Bbin03]HDL78676.1 hypothetical protein [Bacteroidota bacterium]HDZ10688.1 hypothetical protein [Bacteroidota bacterium]
MTFFRLLFWGIILYLGYKLVKDIFKPKQKDTEVHGKAKTKPLDIDESQIEDAEFKEIKKDEKKKSTKN